MRNKYRLRLDKVNETGTFRTIVESTYPDFHTLCADVSDYIKMPYQMARDILHLKGMIAGTFNFRYNDTNFIAKISPTSWEL